MVKTKEELLEIRKELFKEKKSLDAKLTNNSNALKRIEKKETETFISTIPKDINKVTAKQWEWILYHYHDSPEGQYDFSHKFIYDNLKLLVSGIHPHTKQYGFNLHEGSRKDFFKGFNFIKKYLKEAEFNLRNENLKVKNFKAIEFTAFGLDDYISPNVYYHKSNRHVTLIYEGRFGKVKEFKSLEAFEKWYDMNVEEE